MSKLIEQLENIGKGTPQPMGFRAVPAEKNKPRMVLIADVSEDIKKLKDYLGGTDAVLMLSNVKAPALPDIPKGSRLADTSQKAIEAAEEGGADFVVFSNDSLVFALDKNSKLGKILQIDNSLSDSLLRTVSELPVDAVLVDSKNTSLTWNDVMALQRFMASGKPLLVGVSAHLAADALKAIWNTGADGIVVRVTAETSADRLAELRKEIGKLAPRIKKRKTEALLPFGGVKAEAEPEPDEEEEEEEE
ncbi:MAG: hypothetical protein PHR56_05625 [Dehalococcoidales bacterium]|nr:hypothetical protein [Dehalococcoidales bacterium]